jgi:predicted DsbA family dithiol-disulfide isomerase
MRRLSLILRGVLVVFSLSTAISAYAAPDTPKFYVVEIANFACSHCRAMESSIPGIADAAQQAGGKYVFGPIVWDEQPIARDLVYYAARIQGNRVERAVRASLYKAVQDNGLLLEDAGQTMAWLQQDIGPEVPIDFSRLSQDAADSVTALSEVKAAKLAESAGVTGTPTFVFLKDGKSVAILSANPGEASPSALASRVKAEILDISK